MGERAGHGVPRDGGRATESGPVGPWAPAAGQQPTAAPRPPDAFAQPRPMDDAGAAPETRAEDVLQARDWMQAVPDDGAVAPAASLDYCSVPLLGTSSSVVSDMDPLEASYELLRVAFDGQPDSEMGVPEWGPAAAAGPVQQTSAADADRALGAAVGHSPPETVAYLPADAVPVPVLAGAQRAAPEYMALTEAEPAAAYEAEWAEAGPGDADDSSDEEGPAESDVTSSTAAPATYDDVPSFVAVPMEQTGGERRALRSQRRRPRPRGSDTTAGAATARGGDGKGGIRTLRTFLDSLSSDERRSMAYEELPDVPPDKPLSREQEAVLKGLRRKVRNKLSAHMSRKRRKHYISDLEQRVVYAATQNAELRQKLTRLEAHGRTLATELGQLRTVSGAPQKAGSSRRSAASRGAAMLALLVMVAVLFDPTVPVPGGGSGTMGSGLDVASLYYGASLRVRDAPPLAAGRSASDPRPGLAAMVPSEEGDDRPRGMAGFLARLRLAAGDEAAGRGAHFRPTPDAGTAALPPCTPTHSGMCRVGGGLGRFAATRPADAPARSILIA